MRIYPRQSLLTRLHARYLVFCVNSIGQSDITIEVEEEEEEEEAEPRNLKAHSSVALTHNVSLREHFAVRRRKQSASSCRARSEFFFVASCCRRMLFRVELHSLIIS
jgi:hypothetical protein